MILGEEISNNPNNRCIYCKGREIIRAGLHGPYSNLKRIIDDEGAFFACLDKSECERNIEAESTIITYSIDTEAKKIMGVSVTKNGEELWAREKK